MKKIKKFKVLKTIEDKIECIRNKINSSDLTQSGLLKKWYLCGYEDALKKDTSLIEKMLEERGGK